MVTRFYNLTEVFGSWRESDAPTYVDRVGLDQRMERMIHSGKHVVIHGGSKQGKSTLRKKFLPDLNCVVIRCTMGMTVEKIYLEILRQLHAEQLMQVQRARNKSKNNKANGSANLKFVDLGLSGGYERQTGVTDNLSETSTPLGNDPQSLGFMVDEIKRSGERVIIEDFHYIVEEEQKRLSFDLKAFWDSGVSIIISGIWHENNRMTTFNGDLTGRVDEINIHWPDKDLVEVIRKGENALNIRLSDEIRADIIHDSHGNVGLLQIIAEKLCETAKIFHTQEKRVLIKDLDILEASREHICEEQFGRYHAFYTIFTEAGRDGKLSTYEYILRACIEHASDYELMHGIRPEKILQKIQMFQSNVRQSDVTSALQKLNLQQGNLHISPLVFYYNRSAREMHLVDRDLLFYRKYHVRPWPWFDEVGSADG